MYTKIEVWTVGTARAKRTCTCCGGAINKDQAFLRASSLWKKNAYVFGDSPAFMAIAQTNICASCETIGRMHPTTMLYRYQRPLSVDVILKLLNGERR